MCTFQACPVFLACMHAEYFLPLRFHASDEASPALNSKLYMQCRSAFTD